MNGKAKSLSDRNTFFIYDTDERGSGLEENVRLCSLMFAYVRLMGKKMFAAPDGERSSILQKALQTEIGTRGTRPSGYQRQSEARTTENLPIALAARGHCGLGTGE